MEYKSSFSVDFYFDSISELKKGFSLLENQMGLSRGVYELNLRIHWTKELLTPEALNWVRQRTQSLFDHFEGLNLILQLPFCAGKAADFAPFPNCDTCAFLEAYWCHWPRQIGRKYYTVPQQDFYPDQLDHLKREDFEGKKPVTWFYPQKRQIRMAAGQLSKSSTIVDFGCGNGFISYLISIESPSNPNFLTIDPFMTPQFSVANFQHSKELPRMNQNWSLLSSLADFNVPLEKCFKQNILPRDIVFFRFPDVFGNGGEKIQLSIKGDEISSLSHIPLFNLDELGKWGYKLLHLEKSDSHFMPNSEMRVYSLVDSELSPNTSSLDFYAWEKSSVSKNEATSTLDLS